MTETNFALIAALKSERILHAKHRILQKYEEVVFNPPFRQEAERRTKQLTEEGPYSKEPKKESVHFDWNLDGFPDRDSKKTMISS